MSFNVRRVRDAKLVGSRARSGSFCSGRSQIGIDAGRLGNASCVDHRHPARRGAGGRVRLLERRAVSPGYRGKPAGVANLPIGALITKERGKHDRLAS
jgi:hypothetical protein